MPYFAVCAIDRPGMEDVRKAVRPAHRVRLRAGAPDCVCVAGGPLLDDAAQGMVGTLLVFEARDAGAVERFLAGDPYTEADLYQAVNIWPWQWGLGQPEASVLPPI